MTDSNQLRRSRPKMPNDYGVPATEDGMLDWDFVEEKLLTARSYWVATVGRGHQPHSTPVWGAWIDGRMYLEGSPETRRARNMRKHPAVAVHLESADQVVIIEGRAEELGKPAPDLAERLSKQFCEKYKAFDYQPGPDSWDHGGLFCVTPELVLAWTKFPDTATRWSR